MIRLSHVSKAYATHRGAHTVLDDISIEFESHVSFGVIGLNGAGKSTLLRIIGGIEMPDVGDVKRDVRLSWPIGFAGGFNGLMSGEENARFVARIYGEDVDRVVDFARDFAEIGEYFQMPLRTYSSGMKGRLAFGLSMAIDFEVYLIDEATATGDVRFREKARRLLDERRERSSVIMVSHNPATIRQHCDRCAVLTNGKLQLYDSVDAAAHAYQGALPS